MFPPIRAKKPADCWVLIRRRRCWRFSAAARVLPCSTTGRVANSRTSHAALKGEKWGVHDIPARSGMSVGMVLISLELLLMLIILVFLPVDLAGKCFIGFAIGESLGASALRVAGGVFTKGAAAERHAHRGVAGLLAHLGAEARVGVLDGLGQLRGHAGGHYALANI